MDTADLAHLWKRRLFEAEAGLTRWLVEKHQGRHLEEWISAQEEIFSGLPEDDDPDAWRCVFFRGQAIMERFVVSRYGEAELTAWTQSNGEIYGRTAPSYGPGAAGVATRLARQADGYASDYTLGEGTPEHASITINRCAIWDYRERARRRGVELTLRSPCTYCTRLTAANARAKGCETSWTLHEGPDGHGCHWDIVAAR